MKPSLLALLLFSCPALPLSAQDVTFTATPWVAALQQPGAVEFVIDTQHHKGPFLVIFEKPDGSIDSMPDFSGPSHIYEGLGPGRYCLDIQCCATCSAQGCIDVLDTELLWIDETYVFLAREQAPPEADSTVILMACTGIEMEGDTLLCSVSFSLYAPEDFPAGPVPAMAKKALEGLLDVRRNGYSDFPEIDEGMWMPQTFEMLFRFDGQGRLMWIYPTWK